MGLVPIQDQRPRDWAYAARFKEKDLPSLEEMAQYIRKTHDTHMIQDFNIKCEQKLKTGHAQLENGIEIQEVTKTGDLVLNPGLQQCINIILGISSARWTYFGMAIGSTPYPTVSDTSLVAETLTWRVSLAWAEAVGMRMFFGGISSQTNGFVPDSVGEIGVYNGSAAGAVLLNRSVFANNRASQNSNVFSVSAAPIVVSAVIEFCPVV